MYTKGLILQLLLAQYFTVRKLPTKTKQLQNCTFHISLIHRRKILACITLVEVRTKIGFKFNCSPLTSEMILAVVLPLYTVR